MLRMMFYYGYAKVGATVLHCGRIFSIVANQLWQSVQNVTVAPNVLLAYTRDKDSPAKLMNDIRSI